MYKEVKKWLNELSKITPIQLKPDTIHQIEGVIQRAKAYTECINCEKLIADNKCPKTFRQCVEYPYKIWSNVLYEIVKGHYLIDGNKRAAFWIIIKDYENANRTFFNDEDRVVNALKKIAASKTKQECTKLFHEVVGHFWKIYDEKVIETSHQQIKNILKRLEKE